VDGLFLNYDSAIGTTNSPVMEARQFCFINLLFCSKSRTKALKDRPLIIWTNYTDIVWFVAKNYLTKKGFTCQN